jgi:hypothetical protein
MQNNDNDDPLKQARRLYRQHVRLRSQQEQQQQQQPQQQQQNRVGLSHVI